MVRVLTSLRDAITTFVLLLQQAALSLRYNWGIGILSLVLATSLWVYVTDRGDQDLTVRIPGAVAVEVVNVPPGQAVYPPLDQAVNVRVRGPESVVEDLRADDFRATVDLADVRTDQAVIRVDVESPDARVDIIEITPAQVAVRLEPVRSRTVPVRVRLVGAPPRGFEAGDPAVDPLEATISGPESLVALVDAVEADVNLTGVRTNFEERVLLEVRDDSGGNIEGVDVTPESALVSVELTQLDFSAGFVVRPDITGSPAPGFNATSVQVEPSIVIVSGPAEIFSTLDPVQGIATAPVSIEAATADVVRTVALRLPEGATVQQANVTVRVTIQPAEGSFSFTVAVQPVNTPSGLTATLDQPSVLVVLAGAVPDLQAVTPEQITATVDLSGLAEGEHAVTVNVSAPSGLRIVSVTPATVNVTLQAPP